LENVLKLRKAVPMKGEIPHRHGNIMAGRYPKNASIEFIKLLKSLLANANFNEMENPIISEAIANKAQRPFGKGGRTKKKRSHIKLIAREKKENKNKK
jgi:ribosomal protein L22